MSIGGGGIYNDSDDTVKIFLQQLQQIAVESEWPTFCGLLFGEVDGCTSLTTVSTTFCCVALSAPTASS